MLSGFIWNGRGVGDSGKRDFIRESVVAKKIDFIGIQESMKQDCSDSFNGGTT
jgi:hypothetical protein